ncbi:MAG: sulfotransferase [Candidatus Omnitrophica bacterium]|nr:sulfotransferase [Candidatus Omnitrophota bacterium]
MQNKKKNTILVTGSHRSGTTFVGKMLALSPNVGYIFEPFNKVLGVEGVDVWNPYIKNGGLLEKKYHYILKNVLNGKAKYKEPWKLSSKNKQELMLKTIARNIFGDKKIRKYRLLKYKPWVTRLLIKDPIACFSAEWMHKKLNMDTVIIIRHPVAFIGSIKRLNYKFDFQEFIKQKELMDDFLGERIDLNIDFNKLSIIEEGALLWNCIYSVLFAYLDRNPNMIGIRHEDISNFPVEKFQYLYDKLNLVFTKKIEIIIKRFTNIDNPSDPVNNRPHVLKRNSQENIKRWKKLLNLNEIKQIRMLTEPLACKFYNDMDW